MEITTTNGYAVLIDDHDFPKVAPHKWTAYRFGSNAMYATANIGGKTVYMHRLLMDAPHGVRVDHKNGNGLDNRRVTNLRLATHAQNARNQRLRPDNTSGHRGVSLVASGRWYAQIKCEGKHRSCGTYDTVEEAIIARKAAERELFGEFAPYDGGG